MKNIIKTIDIDDSYLIPIVAQHKDILKHPKFKKRIMAVEKAKHCSDTIISFLNQDLSTKVSEEHLSVWEDIKKHYNEIKASINGEILLPLFADTAYYRVTSVGIFDDLFKAEGLISKQVLAITGMRLADTYIYVYVPQNFATDNLVFFETEQLQRLLNVDLYQIMDTLNNEKILKCSSIFKENITHLSKQLQDYEIIDNSNEDDLNVWELFNYISNKVFPKYRLEKKTKVGNIPLSQTSSGEKQQAIMDIIYLIVKEHINDRLIIAIDEPESSFHLSERFEQFNKLYEISKNSGQVLFASHWYGFIPSIPDGCVLNIVDNNGDRSVSVLDIYKYKEEVAQENVDITLKGYNDLIQTMVSSVLMDNSYNWLICEGTSDKIYLAEYLKDDVKQLRIVPIGGCDKVELFYKPLQLSFFELTKYIKGKIFVLLDTDKPKKASSYKDITEEESIFNLNPPHSVEKCKSNLKKGYLRNIESTKKTILHKDSKNVNTATVMEDVLNGKVFNIVLQKYKSIYPELLDFVDENDEKEQIPSYYAMNLDSDNYQKLKSFFYTEDKWDNKVPFARAYVEEIQKGGYKEPSWITEIKNFFK